MTRLVKGGGGVGGATPRAGELFCFASHSWPRYPRAPLGGGGLVAACPPPQHSHLAARDILCPPEPPLPWRFAPPVASCASQHRLLRFQIPPPAYRCLPFACLTACPPVRLPTRRWCVGPCGWPQRTAARSPSPASRGKEEISGAKNTRFSALFFVDGNKTL